MKLFNIYCGLDTNGRLTQEEAAKTAKGLAMDYFPQGHTIIEAQGRWDQGGVAVTEPTIIIQVLTDDEQRARDLAGAYKHLGFQEAVMITKQEVDADFV